MGYGMGQRLIELISCRDRVTKRETRLVNMLQVSFSILKNFSFFMNYSNIFLVCITCCMETFIQ